MARWDKLIRVLTPLTLLVCGTVHADTRTHSVDFQGRRWIATDPAALSVTTHLGRRALRVASDTPGSRALIQDVHFRSGIIELDLASDGYSQPTLLLYAKQGDPDADKITLHPQLAFDDDPRRRLNQGVITDSGRQTSIVVNFFHDDDESDVKRRRIDDWFHVRLEIDDELCRVYFEEDSSPALIFGNMFRHCRGTSIGFGESAAFIRNFRMSGTDGDVEAD